MVQANLRCYEFSGELIVLILAQLSLMFPSLARRSGGGFRAVWWEGKCHICSKIYAGHQPEVIEEKVSRVEEFAELGPYFDRPFKTYSSGMRSRVTFGLSMAFDFDLYLIDEVTSAGDERFRKRSRKVLEGLHQRADFMMVDHNLWGLQLHCDRALLLHDGGLMEFDDLLEGSPCISSCLNSDAEQAA